MNGAKMGITMTELKQELLNRQKIYPKVDDLLYLYFTRKKALINKYKKKSLSICCYRGGIQDLLEANCTSLVSDEFPRVFWG
jgi:hypothetical protein